MPLRDWFLGLLGRRGRHEEGVARKRGIATHVIILDGTASSLAEGRQTNAGLTYQLICEAGRQANLTVYYEAGIQWRDWRSTWDVMTGRGINRQIRRAYGVLASRYRPGDKIMLVGYSRGAYAVRSLAGVIDQLGLLQVDHATVSNIRTAYRHYQDGGLSDIADEFRAAFCHDTVEIEAVAVWDTVKALGLNFPILWRLSAKRHAFHNHRLGDAIRHGFHALALHETRVAYSPVMWRCEPDWPGSMEQVWFRGVHGDIGAQLNGYAPARPLSNIPLVWMLDRLEMCGLELIDGWRTRFETSPVAPSVGLWRGMAWVFLNRRRRAVGLCPSERLHDTVPSDDPRADAMDKRD